MRNDSSHLLDLRDTPNNTMLGYVTNRHDTVYVWTGQDYRAIDMLGVGGGGQRFHGWLNT